uniref:ABC transmembrane type-1 domain-containing protein n=1 Tax=Panagrolaimus sp. JU765 TaxID=591449 RepID=A0AC34R628_9BILA
MKDGEITDFGTYEELCSRKNSTFDELLKELRIKQQEEEENVEDATLVEEMNDVLLELIGSPTNRELQVHRRARTTSDEMLIGRQISVSSTHSNSSHPIICRSTSHLANAKLVEDEELAAGKVNSKMYLEYIKACGVGLCVAFFFTMFLVHAVLEGTSKIWLSKWTTEMASNFTQTNPVIDLGIYAGFGFSSFIFLSLARTMVAVGSHRASKKLHDGLLFSLLRSPMTFFDTTPVGRILNRLSNDIEKIDDDVPGKMGFTTGTSIGGLLGQIARNVKDLEQSIVSVERVQEYVDNEHEAEWDSLASPRLTWPEKGEVKFSDFSLKYRQNTPLVLKHLNLTVFPGQKVGIVGRTGAGKTSLTMALFRIVEPATGTIFIDDVDFRNEATAAVDVETDQLIQQSIRTEFSNCTILTIAHRLNTILDYDKVLVMDSGEIREFDSPKKLLENKQSLFYGLAVQAKLI